MLNDYNQKDCCQRDCGLAYGGWGKITFLNWLDNGAYAELKIVVQI